jgi:MFS family permease
LAAGPIVAVLALGAGAGETGLLQTAQTLPFLLLAIPAGVLADRASRRLLMAWAEALRALSLLGILALAGLGLLTVPWLALLGFVGACGTVAYSVAAPALVPALVPMAILAAANTRIELARTAAFVAGPALAGALVGWTGGAPAFALAAALSSVAVVLLAGLLLGCLGARLFSRVLASQLWGITPTDPLTYVAGAVLVVLAGLLACLGPARRAVGVDPTTALRAE